MSRFKFNWGHGVILGLLGFIVFILTLIYKADVSGDLVNDDYYEKSLTYQKDNIDASNRAKILSEKPEFVIQANGINVLFPIEIKPDSGQVYLMRGALKKDDVLIDLNLNSRNQILVPAVKLKEGEYDVNLTWYENGVPYLIKSTIEWTTP